MCIRDRYGTLIDTLYFVSLLSYLLVRTINSVRIKRRSSSFGILNFSLCVWGVLQNREGLCPLYDETLQIIPELAHDVVMVWYGCRRNLLISVSSYNSEMTPDADTRKWIVAAGSSYVRFGIYLSTTGLILFLVCERRKIRNAADFFVVRA